MEGMVEGLIDLDLMATSMAMAMGMKLFFFIVAALLIHVLLSWMDWRSGGGFKSWREACLKEDGGSLALFSLGMYYCIRIAVLYIWAALLFSS